LRSHISTSFGIVSRPADGAAPPTCTASLCNMNPVCICKMIDISFARIVRRFGTICMTIVAI